MDLTHIDKDGNAIMVDVSSKEDTKRIAVAKGTIKMHANTIAHVINNDIKKGNVLTVSKVAGIMAAKNTSTLIPMCHPLLLTGVDVTFDVNQQDASITVTSTVKTKGNTGVEMEALTAVNVTLLTIYDMCKAIDKKMVITDVHLVSKSGGKSGDFSYEG